MATTTIMPLTPFAVLEALREPLESGDEGRPAVGIAAEIAAAPAAPDLTGSLGFGQ